MVKTARVGMVVGRGAGQRQAEGMEMERREREEKRGIGVREGRQSSPLGSSRTRAEKERGATLKRGQNVEGGG
jgi:hypothetical protein